MSITEKEKTFLSFLQKKKKKLKLVDVGAYQGEYIDNIRTDFEIEKCFIFEPISTNYEILKKKFTDENFYVYNMAIGSSSNDVLINRIDGHEALSSIIDRKCFEHFKDCLKKENVKMVRLDNIIDENIDLLKVDVEGFEFEVLKGCSELLKKKLIEYIQFEYGGTYEDTNQKLIQVINYLNSEGYTVYKLDNFEFVEISSFVDDYLLDNFYATYHKLQ